MFTGDESGRWLFRGLFRAGYASQPGSTSRDDGLTLHDCYITAALRCAPPGNKPLPAELARCSAFLLEEFRLLKKVRVVVGLGKIGFENALRGYRALGRVSYHTMPRFAHGALYELSGLSFLATYHPSQQNTFTGRLTEAMFDRVFALAREKLMERRG
jgi:uracil-DNA glycosylase family 4